MTDTAAGKMPILRPKNVDHQFQDLEQQLRKNADDLDSVFPQTDTACLEYKAADAIREQAEKIAQLESDLQQMRQYRNELQAKLSRWESQPVVAWAVTWKGEINKNIFNYIEDAVETFARLNKEYPIGAEGRRMVKLIARLPDDEGEKV